MIMKVQFELNIEKGTESVMSSRIKRWIEILNQAVNLGDGVSISDVEILK